MTTRNSSGMDSTTEASHALVVGNPDHSEQSAANHADHERIARDLRTSMEMVNNLYL